MGGLLLVSPRVGAEPPPAGDKGAAKAEKAAGEAKAEVKAGTEVKERELVGEGSSFKKGDTVVVWSNVTGAEGKTVKQVWKLDGKEVFAPSFEIKSNRWRINSRKRSAPAGAWVVEVVTDDGAKLGEVSFKVE
jgi:hypothetical protein